MNLLLDMNLPPLLAATLSNHGFPTKHWVDVGSPTVDDTAILAYAGMNGFVIVTHDLDFRAILAATKAHGPSVVQVRTQDVISAKFVETLTNALKQFESEISTGAIVVVDESRAKAR